MKIYAADLEKKVKTAQLRFHKNDVTMPKATLVTSKG